MLQVFDQVSPELGYRPSPLLNTLGGGAQTIVGNIIPTFTHSVQSVEIKIIIVHFRVIMKTFRTT